MTAEELQATLVVAKLTMVRYRNALRLIRTVMDDEPSLCLVYIDRILDATIGPADAHR